MLGGGTRLVKTGSLWNLLQSPSHSCLRYKKKCQWEWEEMKEDFRPYLCAFKTPINNFLESSSIMAGGKFPGPDECH